MEIRMAEEENEDAFPGGDQAFVRPSLTCIFTGRLTEIPGGPSSAESSFNMWPKGGLSSQSQSLTKEQSSPVCSQPRPARSEWRR